MAETKCKICGGSMVYSLHSEYAVCENCENTIDVDPQELGKIRMTYRNAELKTYPNTAEGYAAAISQLQTISFVREAREKIADCETRLHELKETEASRSDAKEHEEKSEGRIGIIILVLLLLVIGLAIAGAGYIVYHLYMGDLSPTATAIIIASVAVFAVLLIINKIRS